MYFNKLSSALLENIKRISHVPWQNTARTYCSGSVIASRFVYSYCSYNVADRNIFHTGIREICLPQLPQVTFNQKPPVKCLSTSEHSATLGSDSSKASESKASEEEEPEVVTVAKLSRRAQLKKAVKEYGATVVVFHVGISLFSLGVSYLAISTGLDVPQMLASAGLFETPVMNKITAQGSTFVIAYAVHKVFAPVRISITLVATPFIVRHLRKIGFLKPAGIPKK